MKKMRALISQILALTLVFSLCAPIYAEEPLLADIVLEDPVYEGPMPEETLFLPEETIEPEDETAEIVEPYVLPDGLQGLPEEYTFSDEELRLKISLTEKKVVSTLEELTPGVDYAADHVLAAAETKEMAHIYAAAFGAELEDFLPGMAILRLSACSVPEAVKAAADMASPLPAVSPDYYTRIEEPVCPEEESDNSLSAAYEEKDWQYWVREQMTNPDPYLLDPTALNYQWMHDTVGTYAAWGVTTGGQVINRSAVKVAVIDTGVQSDNADLTGRVQQIQVGSLPTAPDTSYLGQDHGTHVASIIAGAKNNGEYGAGIAPEATILSLRVEDSWGVISDASIIQAINLAVSNGAWIINMSIGSTYYNPLKENAVQNAIQNGVTVVASAGNSGSNSIEYPAAFDGVIGVAATDRNNRRAFFSNYGSWVDICAPGVDIYSAADPYYICKSGTSMASPIIAGACALYMGMKGKVSPAEMQKVLKASANKCSDAGMGAGILNLRKMFSGNYSEKNSAPLYGIYLPGGGMIEQYKNELLPCESIFHFISPVFDDDTCELIYTLDGKTPALKNGEITVGTVYDGSGIPLSPYAGKTVTIKAARITGMGLLSKVLTLKLRVDYTKNIQSVGIFGGSEIVAGKSQSYKAFVYPTDTAEQKVSWSISDYSGMSYGVSLSAKGVLKAPSNASGSVCIRATSQTNPGVYGEKWVDIVYREPVSKVVLNEKSVELYTGYYIDKSINDLIKFLDKKNQPVGTEFSLANNTPAVAYGEFVDEGRNLRIHSGKAGTAKLTFKALDGSEKSAALTVNVRQSVDSIAISGNRSVARGTSAGYKATVYPSNAYKKKVTWSLENAPAGVRIDANGKLTVDSLAANGAQFYVVATAQDWGAKYMRYPVTVADKCTSVNLYCSEGRGAPWVAYNKNGWVSSVQLSVIDPEGSAFRQNTISLRSYTPGNTTPCLWTSSNNAVAVVDQDGNVTAVGKGSANITCKAQDGSNKSASCKVKVIVPVSSLSVYSKAPRRTEDYNILAFGKSVGHTVEFAATYGIPSNKKVNWSVLVVEEDPETGYWNNDYTDYCLRNKLVSINNSGSLSTSSKLAELYRSISGLVRIIVTATSQENPEVYDFEEYYAYPGATYLKGVKPANTALEMNKEYSVVFNSDAVSLYRNGVPDFTVTSSNPQVAGLSKEGISYCGGDSYEIQFYTGIKKGSATITVKTTDGTNKSWSFTVRVQ